jgi:hypothetical protein
MHRGELKGQVRRAQQIPFSGKTEQSVTWLCMLIMSQCVQASLASGFTGQVHHRMQPSLLSFKTVSFMKLLPRELSLLPQSSLGLRWSGASGASPHAAFPSFIQDCLFHETAP